MRNSKWDKKIEKAVLKLLDSAARKYGMKDARHGVSKWLTAQRARTALAKAQRELEKKLAEVNARLRT